MDETCPLLAAQVVQNSRGHVIRVPLIGELLPEQVITRRRDAAGPRFADSCCRTNNSVASR